MFRRWQHFALKPNKDEGVKANLAAIDRLPAARQDAARCNLRGKLKSDVDLRQDGLQLDEAVRDGSLQEICDENKIQG